MNTPCPHARLALLGGAAPAVPRDPPALPRDPPAAGPARRGLSSTRSKAAWLVVSVWLVLTCWSFGLVWRFALSSPIADEWRYMGVATGAEPLDGKWLFQIENQHCAPVFKLAYLSLGWATDFDFRAGAFVNVALLAALALAMIAAAAKVRGHTSPWDVLFPVLLLHGGHSVNVIWGFQLFYILPTALIGVVLLVLATIGPRLSLGAAAGVAGCLAAAGFCGGPGVFYVPPLAAWLGYAGLRRYRGDTAENGAPSEPPPQARASGHRLTGMAIILLALLACLPLAPYALARSEAMRFPPPLEPTRVGPVLGTIAFLGLGLGKIGKELWPASGIAIAVLLAFAARVLHRHGSNDPEERLAASGLGMFLCGGTLLAVGTGLARGHMAPHACLQYRYMILATPLVLALYWVAIRCGREITQPRLRSILLAAVLVMTAWYNGKGWKLAAGMRETVDALEHAIAAGMQPAEAAVRFAEVLQDPKDSLQAHLEMLRVARIGPYRPANVAGHGPTRTASRPKDASANPPR